MANTGSILEKRQIKDLVYQKVMAYFDQNMPHVDPWIRWREIERYCFETAAATFRLNQYDLIHAQDIVSSRALWRAKAKRTSLITTIHGCLASEFIHSGEITDKNFLAWKYVSAEEHYGALSSNATIVPTRWLESLSNKDFRIPGSHMKVIPYGIDIDSFLAKMEQGTTLKAPADKKVLICPARLVPVKGHKHLLEALAMLKQHRTDWICWLLGDGPLRDELIEQCRSLKLLDHVVFWGSRSDVPALLKQSHVFVLSSLQDNLPFSVMEAQLAGKAVVVTDAGGIPEMVSHGKTGLISPAGQSRQMYQNLKTILADDLLRKRMGEQAKQWAQQMWSIQTMMEQTLNVYESIVGRAIRGGKANGR
jgi:glycosyltransferase involved in cell wall biosynthesis